LLATSREVRRVDNQAASPAGRYTLVMEHIGAQLAKIEQNIKINSADPIAQHGFTQVPNFILRNPDLSTNAKTAFALLLSYAWHNNRCYPGQERMAEDMGTHAATVSRAMKELEEFSLIEIERRGQGKTNYYTLNFVVQKRSRKS